MLFTYFLLFTSTQAQVLVETFAVGTQTGLHNYYGVRVILPQSYNYDVTIAGYVFDEGMGLNTDHPFSLTVTAGSTTAESAANFYETGPASGAQAQIASINYLYAGVSVLFEIASGILKFNSVSDVATVLNQLDTDYEAYNDNYESQYPNLTAEQLDDMDEQTGFDEFKPYRDFESLFAGFYSKRGEIENMEISWLANNFGGTDPDDVDLTFDDAENTIFNSTYSFKVGNDIYQLASDGMYLNGLLYADGMRFKKPANESLQGIYSNAVFLVNSSNSAIDAGPGCRTNKRLKKPFEPAGLNRKFELKVAINAIGVRNAVKAKVVHYRYKNGRWKKSRADLAVSIVGTTYYSNCYPRPTTSKVKPNNGGFLRKKRLKVTDSEVGGSIWWTQFGELTGSFATADGLSGALSLTW